MHEYMIFLPFSFSYTPSCVPSTYTHWCRLRLYNTYFTFLFSVFEKRHFCLYKIAIQGVLLWHFHVYMFCNLNWFIPSIFLLFTLVNFLWWIQKV
jgi:hypothetical protein